MNKETNYKYWLCQLVGWTFYLLALSFFAFQLEKKFNDLTFYRLSIQSILGLICTHTIRYFIYYLKLLVPLTNKKLVKLTLVFLVIFTLSNFINSLIVNYLHLYNSKEILSLSDLFILNFIFDSPLILIWISIYYFWHYIQYNKIIQFQEVQLKASLKELELNNIKYKINPHFIFNALNCIRSLVEENPNLARTGITKLSNILRQSLQQDKQDLITLNEEIAIVKDYLDLEKIRFEDRLLVHYIIEQSTLNIKIPIMIIQIMVENSIKHGLSKLKDGGHITIHSYIENKFLQIEIINSGQFNPTLNHNGFGIKSTIDRLNYLYNQSAFLNIKNLDENQVKVSINIPIL